jgi:hypothetical protein
MSRHQIDEVERDAAEHNMVHWPQHKALDIIGHLREAYAEVETFTFDADHTSPEPGVQPTTAQFWGQLLGMTPAHRQRVLGQLLEDARAGELCRVLNHRSG